jgi:hypothetical protein
VTQNARLGLAFAAPAPQKGLGLPQTLTRRLIKQKARHHPQRGSDTLSAHGFRIYFTPLTAVLFTFPSRYLFTIGRQLVFSLTPWSAWIHAAFHVCRVTQEIPRRTRAVGYGPLTLLGAGFHPLHLAVVLSRWVLQPRGKTPGLGSSAFVRHYLRNRFSFFSSGY